MVQIRPGAPYTNWIASLELPHKKHNNDPYNSAYIDFVYQITY